MAATINGSNKTMRRLVLLALLALCLPMCGFGQTIQSLRIDEAQRVTDPDDLGANTLLPTAWDPDGKGWRPRATSVGTIRLATLPLEASEAEIGEAVIFIVSGATVDVTDFSIRGATATDFLYFETVTEATTYALAENGYHASIQETSTTYRYAEYAPGFTVDYTYVLTTGQGGDSRWIGESGQYAYYQSEAQTTLYGFPDGQPDGWRPAWQVFYHWFSYPVDRINWVSCNSMLWPADKIQLVTDEDEPNRIRGFILAESEEKNFLATADRSIHWNAESTGPFDFLVDSNGARFVTSFGAFLIRRPTATPSIIYSATGLPDGHTIY